MRSVTNYPYMSGNCLIEELNEMVETGNFSNFEQLKDTLSYRLAKLDDNNPFGAGRPSVFSEEDEDKMLEWWKVQKMSFRQIAEMMECTQSTVSLHVHRAEYRYARKNLI